MEEEKIIKEGLSTHTKSDIICYVGMAVLFIMIFIPPVFRVVFYDAEANKPKPQTVFLDLKCRKAAYKEKFKLITLTETNYIDSKPQKAVISFSYDNLNAIDDIPEVNELLSVRDTEGVLVERTSDGYKITLDYANYDLNKIEVLSKYGALTSSQMKLYEDMSFYCESEVVTKEKED